MVRCACLCHENRFKHLFSFPCCKKAHLIHVKTPPSDDGNAVGRKRTRRVSQGVK